MAISFDTAVQLIARKATELSEQFAHETETVALTRSIGRTVAHDHRSPTSTPPHDCSAMDGYAVSASFTKGAGSSAPLTMQVIGTVAAGDPELLVPNQMEGCIIPCVEIMTGARFPTSTSGPRFDACIPLELVEIVRHPGRRGRFLQIHKSVSENQHRRIAGEDFAPHDIIVRAGETVTGAHVMALASLGFSEVTIFRRVRVGLFSTGFELKPREDGPCASIRDANGPYLTAVLERVGAEVEFLRVLEDDPAKALKRIQEVILHVHFDIILSTGGVSTGKFDVIPHVLRELKSQTVFHGVAMRPGHPVLCATIQRQKLPCHADGDFVPAHSNPKPAEIIYFGLPGNPVATAVCFHTLVMSYLSAFGVRRVIPPCNVQLSFTERDQPKAVVKDDFRHGFLQRGPDGLKCSLSADQRPSKIRPFSRSNCIIRFPQGARTEAGSMVFCYPLENTVGDCVLH